MLYSTSFVICCKTYVSSSVVKLFRFVLYFVPPSFSIELEEICHYAY